MEREEVLKILFAMANVYQQEADVFEALMVAISDVKERMERDD